MAVTRSDAQSPWPSRSNPLSPTHAFGNSPHTAIWSNPTSPPQYVDLGYVFMNGLDVVDLVDSVKRERRVMEMVGAVPAPSASSLARLIH